MLSQHGLHRWLESWAYHASSTRAVARIRRGNACGGIVKKINAIVLALGLGAVITLAGCGGTGGDTAAFCEKMAALDQNDPTAGTVEGSDDFFDASIGAMQEVRDVAPDEIQSDVDTMLSAFEDFREIDPTELAESDLADLEEQFASIDEATTRIDEFIETNCES